VAEILSMLKDRKNGGRARFYVNWLSDFNCVCVNGLFSALASTLSKKYPPGNPLKTVFDYIFLK
jgi:hypothetical protein